MKKKCHNFPKNFFKNFWAMHTKGLKPFRAHSDYRNYLGVRSSLFTEDKSVKPAQSGTIRHSPAQSGMIRHNSARSGFFQCPDYFDVLSSSPYFSVFYMIAAGIFIFKYANLMKTVIIVSGIIIFELVMVLMFFTGIVYF